MKQNALLLVFLVGYAGCSSVEPKIPVGTYRDRSRPDFIDVYTNQMRVHIGGVDARDTNGTGLTFDYVLWSDDRVFLLVPRSAELFYGYPALEYRWDGERIIARDPKTNAEREFRR